ncbi:uncharacterized protein NEMAJ01_0378 [Nematocida major]|uniref:uncharacterized protein n=1 Tax=Nematocida major TaxID=1912982 RepID=UPI002007C356|nr:uncharacterized protein NEMAJ01_0378 [Nematocida major]KAH9385482.1 hypothetical protein NEMAJ01_0378 [Nematocida major]
MNVNIFGLLMYALSSMGGAIFSLADVWQVPYQCKDYTEDGSTWVAGVDKMSSYCIVDNASAPIENMSFIAAMTIGSPSYRAQKPAGTKMLTYDVINGTELNRKITPERIEYESLPANESYAGFFVDPELSKMANSIDIVDYMEIFANIIQKGPLVFSKSGQIETPEVNHILQRFPIQYVSKTLQLCAKKYLLESNYFFTLRNMMDSLCLRMEGETKHSTDKKVAMCGSTAMMVHDSARNKIIDSLTIITKKTNGILKVIKNLQAKKMKNLIEMVAIQVRFELEMVRRLLEEFDELDAYFKNVFSSKSHPAEDASHRCIMEIDTQNPQTIRGKASLADFMAIPKIHLNETVARPSVSTIFKKNNTEEIMSVFEAVIKNPTKSIQSDIHRINGIASKLKAELGTAPSTVYLMGKMDASQIKTLMVAIYGLRQKLVEKETSAHVQFVAYNNLVDVLCKTHMMCEDLDQADQPLDTPLAENSTATPVE